MPCIDKDYTGRIHSSIYFSIRRDTEIRSFCGIQRISSSLRSRTSPLFFSPLHFFFTSPSSDLPPFFFHFSVIRLSSAVRIDGSFFRSDRNEIRRTSIERYEEKRIEALRVVVEPPVDVLPRRFSNRLKLYMDPCLTRRNNRVSRDRNVFVKIKKEKKISFDIYIYI